MESPKTFLSDSPTSHVLPHQLVVLLEGKVGTVQAVSWTVFRTSWTPENFIDLLQISESSINKESKVGTVQASFAPENLIDLLQADENTANRK